MRLFLYYITHSFVNSIKKLFRTWVIVFILVITLIGAGVGFGAAFVTDMLDDSGETKQEEQLEDTEEEFDKEDLREGAKSLLGGMTEQEKDDVYRVIAAIVFAVVLIVILANTYMAEKGGTEIFTMADVNFLFTAPMKPQSVLLFKTVLQMGLILVGSVYMLFQIPNLVLNVGLGMDAVVLLMIMWAAVLMAGKLCNVFVYTLTATHERLRRYIRPFVLAVVLVVCVGSVYAYRFVYQDFSETVLALAGNKTVWSIPFIGWAAGITYTFLAKDFTLFAVYCALMFVGFAVCTWGIWQMKADFYEDALVSANQMQEKLEAAQSGVKTERKRSKKLKRDGEIGRGEGANAFFFKQIYNRRRFAKFGIVTNAMLLYLSCALILAVIKRFTGEFPGMQVYGGLLLMIIFGRSYIGQMEEECRLNFIYLIPEKPFPKIMYLITAESLETLIDLLPGLLFIKVVFGASFLQMCLWLLVQVSFSFILSASAVFINAMIPTSLPDMIKALFMLGLKFIGVFPMLLAVIILAIADLMSFGFAISVVTNVIGGTILLLPASMLLHKGKK